MGKFKKKGDGGGNSRGGRDVGGGAGSHGAGASKRRAYDGLKVLERGAAGQRFQTTKQAQRWADKKHADKKRAALQRLYGEMTDQEKKPISGVFDEYAPEPARAGHPIGAGLDGLESGSSSDCSLSDEEVLGDQIVFKDETLQRVWDPDSRAKRTKKDPSASLDASGRPGGAKGSKAQRVAEADGPSAVGSFMEVPDWDAEDSGGATGRTTKESKGKAKLPEKITFGDKQRPEVLAVLSKKADEKRKQVELERAEAQKARYVARE